MLAIEVVVLEMRAAAPLRMPVRRTREARVGRAVRVRGPVPCSGALPDGVRGWCASGAGATPPGS